MKRQNRCRAFNVLDSRAAYTDFGGFWFTFQPTQDPIAWQALQHYASITPNAAQRQALYVWLKEHPNPAGPEVVQMELL